MIEVKGLQFRYFPGKQIFRGLDLKLESGKVYGLIGRNGSGKTTLLDILAGVIPRYRGSATIKGMEAAKRDRDYMGGIYYIPEAPNHISYSMRDMILLGRLYPSWKEERFLGFMEESGFTMKTKNSQLSRGWKKRVQVSFALAVDPEVLILDEVTDGIDMIAQRAIVDSLIDFTDEGKTIIFSSHHAGEMQKVIDDIVLLEEGEVLYFGNLEEGLRTMGWVPEDEAAQIKESDIVRKKEILGKSHVLFRNAGQYKIKGAPVSLPEFLEGMVMTAKEVSE